MGANLLFHNDLFEVNSMKLPLQITTRNVSLSETALEAIREKAAKLETFSDRIMSCRVLVEAPHRHKHQGVAFNVRIDITVPGHEVVVKREPNEDVYIAIRDSFDAARRQLQDISHRLHRNGIRGNGGFEHPATDQEVPFIEEGSEQGPQATVVLPLGK
jgi:ribosomal subunit interface protein